jgi:acyl-CoA reductase-like NAD-dependent aldehyde dehydrogenase
LSLLLLYNDSSDRARRADEPGDGTVKAEKPRLRMGPIHTRAGRDELLVQLEDGVNKGGELLVGGGMGGRQKGWLLEPPVVAKPAGMTWANQIHYGYDELPFDGICASGYGKAPGR